MENNINIENAPKRNIPRDVFLHLLAIVTLYWASITFVTLLWQFINNFLPDILTDVYQYQARFELMRFAVSSLFIVFPVFIATSWFLNRIYNKEAIVRESKIRKWLLYFTLFVAALIVVGDLVAVINNLLGGETTLRFILKALSVLLVAGFVFGYYLDDVRKPQPTKLAKPFAWGTGALVAVAIIASFFVIGSPNSARLAQFDMQRTSDLDGIQSAIINYWQAKEKIPATLDDLKDPISGYSAPQDPETKQSYDYKVIDATNLKFELCANFSRQSNEKEMGYAQPSYCPAGVYCAGNIRNWSHPAGNFCFERQIDKQLYPANKNIK